MKAVPKGRTSFSQIFRQHHVSCGECNPIMHCDKLSEIFLSKMADEE